MNGEILFIDAGVADRDILLAGCDPAIEVVALDAGQDGLAQVAAALAGRTQLAAVHLVCHGSPGCLHLGSSAVRIATLQAHAEILAAIGAALREGGDILLYGCSVAAGSKGRAFIEKLAALTGADVAASAEAIGSVAPGSGWNLAARIGDIDTGPPFAPQALAAYPHVLAEIPLLFALSGAPCRSPCVARSAYRRAL